MLENGNEYIYGNTAEKLEYNVYEENRVLKEKKKYRSFKKTKFKTVVGILFVFSLALLLMYRYALITELNYNYSRLEKEYEQLLSDNSVLEVVIKNSTDLSVIREEAEERLGMQEPDASQVVFVHVPKTDYTIVADDYKSIDRVNTNDNMFAVLLEKVDRLTKILY